VFYKGRIGEERIGISESPAQVVVIAFIHLDGDAISRRSRGG